MSPGHPLVVEEEAVDDAEEEGSTRQTGMNIIDIIGLIIGNDERRDLPT